MNTKSNSAFSTIGASNHSLKERQPDDFYSTPPQAVIEILKLEKFSCNILEPACGAGHISKVLEANGYNVESRDLIYRGFGKGGCDFLSSTEQNIDKDIITNPPYKHAQRFVEKSLSIITEGHKVAMFLKLTFLEGKSRRAMFNRYPPKTVYVSSSRYDCPKDGIESNRNSSAIAYAWFVWEKGFTGDPIIKWFN